MESQQVVQEAVAAAVKESEERFEDAFRLWQKEREDLIERARQASMAAGRSSSSSRAPASEETREVQDMRVQALKSSLDSLERKVIALFIFNP